MKKMVTEIFRAIFVGLIMPICMVILILNLSPTKAGGQQTIPTQTDATMDTTMEETTENGPTDEMISLKIPVIIDGEVIELELEDYVLAVVLGEMPSNFEIEALKAQAIVARTYVLKACADGMRHESAAVCNISSCCQAYCTPMEFLACGGSQTELEKVTKAVLETSGEVLTYDGELITATYFSCSGGTTEEALEVWGYDIPYLQSVDSPGEEDSAAFARMITISATEFQELLAVRLQGRPAEWFGNVTYTTGGGVATIEIGGVIYKGTTVRKLLKLRSTLFTIAVDGDTILITTKGYGHRVGMSQYGANAMAVMGRDYKEILSHYYTGTVLEQNR